MSLDDLGTIANNAGVVGLSLALVIAFVRGWIITAREYESMRDDRNFYRSIVEPSMRVAERATALASKRERSDADAG